MINGHRSGRDMRFRSISGNAVYECTLQEWEHILEVARDNYWEPMGTVIEFENEFENIYGTSILYCSTIFVTLQVMNSYHGWDGNYTEARDQIVLDADTGELMYALDGSNIDPAFLIFLENGSFRILA